MSDQNAKPVDAYTIDGDLFKVIINDEDQYSIWPEKKEVPAGWKDVGFSGSKAHRHKGLLTLFKYITERSIEFLRSGCKNKKKNDNNEKN